MKTYEDLLKALHDQGVAYAVGGMAAVSHGASTPTFDLDLCYHRTVDNVEKLPTALSPFAPVARRGGGKEALDERWLLSGLPALLTTTAGDLDLLASISGLGTYSEFAERCVTHSLFGVPVQILGLDDLIAAKTAAGRPKDIAMLHELVEIARQRDVTG